MSWRDGGLFEAVPGALAGRPTSPAASMPAAVETEAIGPGDDGADGDGEDVDEWEVELPPARVVPTFLLSQLLGPAGEGRLLPRGQAKVGGYGVAGIVELALAGIASHP